MKKNINLKKIKLVAYPAILVIFLATVCLIIFFVIKYFVQTANKIFGPANNGEISSVVLNLRDYNLVANKLGVVVPVAEEPFTTTTTTTTTTEAVTSTVTSTLDLNTTTLNIISDSTTEKQNLKIVIYNSTKTSGLAGELKLVLQDGGFEVEKVGNTTPNSKKTLIQIKNSKIDNLLDISQLISQKYLVENGEILSEESIFDVIITIGD